MKEIHIRWEGSHDFGELSQRVTHRDRGLYQLYGFHPLYGSNVLLYIGKTEDSFATRILKKRWELNQDSGGLNIHLGHIEGHNGIPDDELASHIDIAERMLIKAHLPAYNVQRNFNLSTESFKGVHIFNWGDYKNLFPEVSAYRWSNHFWNIEDWRDLGEAIESGGT